MIFKQKIPSVEVLAICRAPTLYYQEKGNVKFIDTTRIKGQHRNVNAVNI